MFVVAGVTGNTGSVVANKLLDEGKQVRVIARDPKKVEALKARGAEVVSADLDDPQALAQALAGAEGAYLLSPPDASSKAFLKARRRLVDAVAQAVVAARVPHTVFLSSIGAQHEHGTGIIGSLNYAEKVLAATGLPVTFVRAGYFIENWAGVLQVVKKDGVLPTFITDTLAVPQVSTRDIGLVAAQALLEGPAGGPAGVRVIELGGPVDASAQDVAQVLSRLLDRPVSVVQAPLAAAVPTFTSFGASEDVASLFRDMYEGINNGTVSWQGQPAVRVRGTQSIEETLRPLL
jgi:uncharacterized protein YbjT (DUF2867 family)